jgi:two-component system, OmpR family, KDP operon response regulator KdpE
MSVMSGSESVESLIGHEVVEQVADTVWRREDAIARKKAPLRVYLGAAPGVGKTYAMLSEGHRRADRGSDVVVGDVVIDLTDWTVRRDDAAVHLTKTEWSLLDALARNPGKLLTHGWLLRAVWGEGYGEDVEVLRVFISQLRGKLEPDPAHPSLILTEPGVGYRWAQAPAG